MTDFIQGVNRYQSTLFPETLDAYIDEDNAVRAIAVFIDALDLLRTGFQRRASLLRTACLQPRYDG
ncbi:MAG: hypothetical protein GKR94_06425 [Gammaproteobacteria bacterium]|nr:hypothetical protein [Gammaproteobacteria bacterium]